LVQKTVGAFKGDSHKPPRAAYQYRRPMVEFSGPPFPRLRVADYTSNMPAKDGTVTSKAALLHVHASHRHRGSSGPTLRQIRAGALWQAFQAQGEALLLPPLVSCRSTSMQLAPKAFRS